MCRHIHSSPAVSKIVLPHLPFVIVFRAQEKGTFSWVQEEQVGCWLDPRPIAATLFRLLGVAYGGRGEEDHQQQVQLALGARQKKELEALKQRNMEGAGSSKRARVDPKDVASAIVNFKEKTWEEFYDEDLKRLKANPDQTWYPQEWLPFLLAGYPAGKMMLSTLSSGKGK